MLSPDDGHENVKEFVEAYPEGVTVTVEGFVGAEPSSL